MSETSISSDCTPMLLLKALLQDDPLTSRSKSTGSKGELYRPYLRQKAREREEARLQVEVLIILKCHLVCSSASSGVRRSCSWREMEVSREAQAVLQHARSSSFT